MRTRYKVITGVAATLLCVFGYLVFHGYLDKGIFQIKQVQQSSSGHLAMLAVRSDNNALGGLTYFVLIGDHVFSPNELKHAYHSNVPVFDAMATCLDLRWEGSNSLVVTCNDSYVNRESINVERVKDGNIAISYVNISPSTASNTFRPDLLQPKER
jgi:hypothetical protein